MWTTSWPFSLSERQSGIFGLLYALGSMATLLLMCDRRDLGTAVGERPPSAPTEIDWEDFAKPATSSELKEFFEPNLYIYDAYPGGIGFSEPLYRACDTLLSRTFELISACPCENGCPSCVGSRRGSRRRRTLCGMPHPARRTTVCRWVWAAHAVRNHLWRQHHSRPQDRNRRLVACRLHPCYTRRRRSRRFSSFPCVPLLRIHQTTDDDIKALYAYLMTRPAISSIPPSNTVPFPLNIRAFQEGWKIVFFREARFRSDPSRSAEWNRGSSLAEALSDCVAGPALICTTSSMP